MVPKNLRNALLLAGFNVRIQIDELPPETPGKFPADTTLA
jgi:hypothetical protein